MHTAYFCALMTDLSNTAIARSTSSDRTYNAGQSGSWGSRSTRRTHRRAQVHPCRCFGHPNYRFYMSDSYRHAPRCGFLSELGVQPHDLFLVNALQHGARHLPCVHDVLSEQGLVDNGCISQASLGHVSFSRGGERVRSNVRLHDELCQPVRMAKWHTVPCDNCDATMHSWPALGLDKA